MGDQFGSLKVVGFTTKDGGTKTLTDPEPPDLTKDCTIPEPPPPPHCTTKVKSLTLRYLGGSCADSGFNFQGGKFECSGAVLGTGPVSMVVTKDADKVSANPSSGINEDDLVTLSRSNGELRSDTKFDVVDEFGNKQSLKIHTSCSRPLNLGDRFGAFEVFSIDRKDEGLVSLGNIVEYQYEVTNLNDFIIYDVSIEDNKLGSIASGLTIPAQESITLFKKAIVSEDTENEVTVTASLSDGGVPECSAIAISTVTIEPLPKPVGSCSIGKPRALQFVYTGGNCDSTKDNLQGDKFKCSGDPGLIDPVQVVITKGADKILVSPINGSIYVGDKFTIYKKDGRKLPAEIKLEIRQGSTVLQSLSIHTSCSKPLNEGDRFGSLILLNFIPKN